MKDIEVLKQEAEAWSIFKDMPENAAIGCDLAAFYLGVSAKTLARYRQNGGGPKYIQYPLKGSRMRNQRVNYLLKDLNEWRESFRVGSSMEAAQLRGLV